MALAVKAASMGSRVPSMSRPKRANPPAIRSASMASSSSATAPAERSAARTASASASAIAFDKGCYTGQEVVLRATQRGQIQRGLVQLELPAGAAPGARLLAAGAEVGVVTSAADLPEGRLGLGYLRRAQWTEGARLALSEGAGEAVVRRVLVEEPAAARAAP